MQEDVDGVVVVANSKLKMCTKTQNMIKYIINKP